MTDAPPADRCCCGDPSAPNTVHPSNGSPCYQFVPWTAPASPSDAPAAEERCECGHCNGDGAHVIESSRCSKCGHEDCQHWLGACALCVKGQPCVVEVIVTPAPASDALPPFADRVKVLRAETGLGLLECADIIRKRDLAPPALPETVVAVLRDAEWMLSFPACPYSMRVSVEKWIAAGRPGLPSAGTKEEK